MCVCGGGEGAVLCAGIGMPWTKFIIVYKFAGTFVTMCVCGGFTFPNFVFITLMVGGQCRHGACRVIYQH